MKTPIASLLALALCAGLAPARAADWYAPQDPFPIYGNSYYVGTGGISAVLITSKAGHVLVDAGGPLAVEQVAAHIRQLGFKVEDIRMILVSHEHYDHAGATAALQKMSGAAVLASPAAVRVLASGQPDQADPQLPNLELIAPVARLRAVRDGETVRVGPLAVTAHFTPGHTKGATSWTWRSEEAGRSVDVVYADSLTALAAEGRRFSDNPLYPNAPADVEHSAALVAALPCDVLLTPHPERGGLWERKARQGQLGDAAFIDRDACRRYAADARANLAHVLADESGHPGQP